MLVLAGIDIELPLSVYGHDHAAEIVTQLIEAHFLDIALQMVE